MPNGEKEKFGSSLQEVDQNIVSLEQERKNLADKANAGKLSRKENKRFSQLDEELTQANNYRTTFQPVPGSENAGSGEFEVDKKTVIGEQPQGTVPGLVVPDRPMSGGGVNPLSSPNITPIDNNNLGVPSIGEIQVPQSGTEQIIQETVQGIQGSPGQGSNVDQAINTATFGPSGGPGKGLQVKKPNEPLIQQGSELFRGIGDPILKGTVGGSIIGSQPVFTPSGDYLSFDVINNRKKALQDAALQREKEANALLSQKPPIVKDQRFQKSLNNQFYGTIDDFVTKAQQEHGQDWDLYLKDQSTPMGREFVQTLANYDFIAGQADQVTDLIAEIDDDLESGDQVFSDETLQMRDDYNQLQNDFLNGDIGGVVNLADKYQELKGFTTLDKIINDQNIDIEGTIDQIAYITDKPGRFETTEQKKKYYEDQVRIIANGLAKNQMRDAVRSGYITEDEIFNRINARYGPENIVSKKVTNKPAGSGIKIEIDPNSFSKGDQTQKVQGTEFNTGISYDIPSNSVDMKGGGIAVVDANGNPSQLDGVQDMKINEIQNVIFVDENGKKTMKPVALTEITVEEPVLDAFGNETGKTNKKTETKMIDLNQEGTRSRMKVDLFNNPGNADQIFNTLDQEANKFNQSGESLFEVDGIAR
jgi:hypothetical protein